jgi:hypothetical protein
MGGTVSDRGIPQILPAPGNGVINGMTAGTLGSWTGGTIGKAAGGAAGDLDGSAGNWYDITLGNVTDGTADGTLGKWFEGTIGKIRGGSVTGGGLLVVRRPAPPGRTWAGLITGNVALVAGTASRVETTGRTVTFVAGARMSGSVGSSGRRWTADGGRGSIIGPGTVDKRGGMPSSSRSGKSKLDGEPGSIPGEAGVPVS